MFGRYEYSSAHPGLATHTHPAEFPELRKRYWGQHMCARGYLCATVGAVDEATMKAYRENQKWDEDDEDSKSPRPPSRKRLSAGTGFRRL